MRKKATGLRNYGTVEKRFKQLVANTPDVKDPARSGRSYGWSVEENPTRLMYGDITMCRNDNGTIIISNKCPRFGGGNGTYWSGYLENFWQECVKLNIPYQLADGWAAVGCLLLGDVPPSHKTKWGIVKAFGTYTSYKLRKDWYWYGKGGDKIWIDDVEGSVLGRRQFLLKDHKGTIIASRHGKDTRYSWQNYSSKCDDKDSYLCEDCPAKFQCLTSADGYEGNIFYVNKDYDLSGFGNYFLRYLKPWGMVDLEWVGDLSKPVHERENEKYN